MRRAVILAGGRGTRLRPYTLVIPKPLMPVGEVPILEIIIRQLADRNFRHITIAVNYQAELFKAYFGDGQKWDLKIDYSLELKPLSTMAPLRLIPDLPENFLVMNGDVLTDLDFEQFMTEHLRESNLFTISAARREQQIDYGVLQVDANKQLCGFEEKPRIPYLVSMGVYCVNRRVLEWIPRDDSFGFDQLMLKLIADQQAVRVRVHEGYWLDIGRPDDYQKALDDQLTWTERAAHE
jgi:NDP-mannose synthase